MIDLGDRREDDTFTFAFTTYGQTGSPADATDLAVCCYKGIGEGESTAGLTLARHDDDPTTQRLGLYRLEVDLDNGIATFSIANRLMNPFPGIEGAAGSVRSDDEFEADDIPTATLNFYQNQALLWTSGVMKGLSTFITGSSADDPVELTVQTMPATPAHEDTFIILGTKGS